MSYTLIYIYLCIFIFRHNQYFLDYNIRSKLNYSSHRYIHRYPVCRVEPSRRNFFSNFNVIKILFNLDDYNIIIMCWQKN